MLSYRIIYTPSCLSIHTREATHRREWNNEDEFVIRIIHEKLA